MASFFEKLKKGMGTAEEPVLEEEETDTAKETEEAEEETAEKKEEEMVEETEIEKEAEKPTIEKIRKPRKAKKQTPEFKIEELAAAPLTEAEPEKKAETSLKIEKEIIEKRPGKEPGGKEKRKWLSFGGEEGQLTIDVYQTENDLVIQTAIAGVGPEDMDVSIERDVVTLRGGREKQYQENGDYFIQECFWGPFSRQIILPAEVDPSRAKASFKEGILTIRMPKIQRERKMKINISA